MINNIFQYFFSLSLLVLLAACSTQIPTESPAPSIIASLEQVTDTPPGVETIEAPTKQATAQPTGQPVLPTVTFIPTLSSIDENTVMELFSTNGYCAFPCWWGIVPGETNWESARNFLEPFAQNIRSIVNRFGQTEYYAEFGVSQDIQPDRNFGVNFRLDERGMVSQIRTQTSWNIRSPDYSLSGLLELLGEPTEIKLHARPLEPFGSSYTYALFYPEKGIMTVKKIIVIGEAKIVEDRMEICPQADPTPPQLWLWSPELTLSFENVGRGLLIESSPAVDVEYYNLEEISSLNPSSFYAMYVNPNGQQCFEISIEKWD